MKFKNLYIASLLLLLGVGATSCIYEDEVLPKPKHTVGVSFQIAVGKGTRANTRAADPPVNGDRSDETTWGGMYVNELGDDYDNFIDLPRLQVVVYQAGANNNLTFVGSVSDMLFSQGSGENINLYSGRGELKDVDFEKFTDGEYRVMVFANVQTKITENTDIDALMASFVKSDGNFNNIPMWGVKTAHLSFQPYADNNLNQIYLLRAVSKVRFKFAADASLNKYSFEQIKFNPITTSTSYPFNTNAAVLPQGGISAEVTTDLNQEVISNAVESLSTSGNIEFFMEDDGSVVTYLPEYVISATSQLPTLTVTLYDSEQKASKDFSLTFDLNPNTGVAAVNGDAFFIRNHLYEFTVTKVNDDGPLYVVPTVTDWIDGPDLEYTIDASTNMRLFDSWLYRYDTDGDVTETNYTNWATSHMLVSSNVDTESTPANRPMQSPQIQLVTKGSGTFELYVDNTDFEILRANKNDVGVVTSYDHSTDGTLTIAQSSEGIYTYFYIVPKSDVTPSNPVARVFLYYNDTVLGKQKMTYNYNSLPGYSDDSSEIWVYYVAPDDYKYTAGTVLKMYYQDVNHPLVPTPVQN